MNQIIQLKAEIELEAKWAVRHETMNGQQWPKQLSCA